MFEHLQIYETRERWMVGAADLVINTASALTPKRQAGRGTPERILILRLERIGDFLMTLGAIRAVRLRAPGAAIHLVVASWNSALAALVPDVDSHETIDVPWLARHQAGDRVSALMGRAWGWRARRFDLAINFEPDIRSNGLLALSGARHRVGFSTGGGGGFLTDALAFDPGSHVAVNARRVVDAALPPDAARPAGEATAARAGPALRVPDDARDAASTILRRVAGRRLIGVHASGGRTVKQWPVERCAAVAARLASVHDAAIVLTGTSEDRALVDGVKAALPPHVQVLDVSGAITLPVLAGVLQQLALFVTGDTGPMHLAAAVDTPVVAIFGPSDPARYGPLSARARVVTADLWCRPCNRVRRPPERCSGGTPDCLRFVEVDAVCRAAEELLRRS